MSEKSHVTILDVAAHAGVSSATVSRVLAGAEYVSEVTRTRVQHSIEELNFQPSSIAQALRRQHSAVIGLIVTDIQNPYYPELVRGIEDSAQRLGYSILLCNSDEDPMREATYLDLLNSQRVDGVIVCSDSFLDRHRKRLLGLRAKVVLVDTESGESDIPSISNDGFRGGQMAARHLIDSGYPEIVYLGSHREDRAHSQRYAGVRSGAGDHLVHYLQAGDSLPSGRDVAIEATKRIAIPFGIAAHNDLAAIGAIRGLQSIGINVPGQVGVIGYDDIAMSEYVTPGLTTIRQHQYDMGTEAMVLMEGLIDGTDIPHYLIVSAELIIRESTMKIN